MTKKERKTKTENPQMVLDLWFEKATDPMIDCRVDGCMQPLSVVSDESSDDDYVG